MSCEIDGQTVECSLNNCDVALIICVWDAASGTFGGACVCQTGTGGTAGTGGDSGTGGTTGGTGGTSATGGTGGNFPVSCTAGQQVVRFDASDIVVGPSDTAYPGSASMYFEGMNVNGGTWTEQCSDLDDDNFTFTCVTSWAPGTWQFQMYMPLSGAGIPGTPPDTIFWGDRNYSGTGCPAQWGGDGSVLGMLSIAPCEDPNTPYLITMVGNPVFADPNPATTCEAGEMLSYNGQISVQ
jgi:hypothetical protein